MLKGVMFSQRKRIFSYRQLLQLLVVGIIESSTGLENRDWGGQVRALVLDYKVGLNAVHGIPKHSGISERYPGENWVFLYHFPIPDSS